MVGRRHALCRKNADVAKFGVDTNTHTHYIYILLEKYLWHAVAQLGHCPTSRKVVGSIPDGFTGIFNDIILPAAL
jgi:hypothetical protein